MKLGEKRFSAILDGTATDLKGQEILVRNIAYEAERLGHDPRQAVEYSLPFLTFVDDVARITIGSGPAAQADTDQFRRWKFFWRMQGARTRLPQRQRPVLLRL